MRETGSFFPPMDLAIPDGRTAEALAEQVHRLGGARVLLMASRALNKMAA